MNIKNWLKGMRETLSGVTRGGSGGQAWLKGEEDTPGGPVLLTSAFQQSTWVYACITTLAENVSAIPFRIVGENAAATKLFEQPHPQMDRFGFWELVVSWLCLRGEAFIVPVRGPGREGSLSRAAVESLLVLCPDQMREVVVGNALAGWSFTGSGPKGPLTSSVLLPEEVIHIRLPNPFHFWRGMSPLTVGWLAAQTDYAAAQVMKGAMLNNADTGLIVTLKEQPGEVQMEQLLAALRDRKRKAGTADRPLLLWGGAKVEKPGVSAMDLELLANRKFNRQEICAIYKVPQELLGYTEDANRSVSDAARLNFVENRIAPLCKRLEAGIDPIVKLFGHELRGEFHVKATPVMQAAQRARIDSGLKLFGAGVPLNVVNEVLELGLPELAHGERSFLGGRYQELGGANESGGKPRALQTLRESRRALKSREVFQERCRTLEALEKGQPQIEAMIADAMLRGEPRELIAQRVRAYFNGLRAQPPEAFQPNEHGEPKNV